MSDEQDFPNATADMTLPLLYWLLPVGLALAALVIALLAFALQSFEEHSRLEELSQGQAAQVQQAMKFREQLQSLGAETARLADNGNAAAKKIVDAMKQQGVTLTASDHP